MHDGTRAGPARPRLSPWRWLAALPILAVVAVGAIELFFRAFPQYLPPGVLFRFHDQAMQANELRSIPHAAFGFLGQPNIRDRFEGLNFGFTYTTDANGFRNPGPWPDRADIVVLGDSQAFGFGVDDGAQWVRRMADGLPGAAVVNLGMMGAAPQQFERFYDAYGASLRPDLVLVAFFPPNAIRTARLFEAWVADGRHSRFDVWRAGGGPPGAADGALAKIKHHLRQSHAALGLYYAARELAGTSGMFTMAFDDGGRIRLVPARYGDEAARAASGDTAFEAAIEALERLHKTVLASGAEMLVVPFPSKEEVHLPLLGEEANRLVEPFIAALERRRIPCLDLTRRLRERAARGEQLFFEIDLHPNVAGQRLIAEVLIEYLQASSIARTRPPAARDHVLADRSHQG